MTLPIAELDVPEERKQAKQIVQSTYIPVGNHLSGSFNNVTPITLTTPDDAQLLKLQVINGNIRYRIDGEIPTSTIGFQLVSGADVLIPVSVNQIIFIGETSGFYQAQWVR